MKLKKVFATLSAAVLTVSASLAYFPSKPISEHILTANAETSSPISIEGNIIWEPIKAEEIKETEDIINFSFSEETIKLKSNSEENLKILASKKRVRNDNNESEYKMTFKIFGIKPKKK